MSKSPRKKVFETYDNSFYWLADSIAAILKENKKDNTTQKEQVLELFEAEKAFKEEILRYKFSTKVYHKFIQKIRYVDRNILYAKTYFREGSDTFSRDITPCLKSADAEGLKKFRINFNLILFIRNNWHGAGLGDKAEKLFKRVERARRVLLENNLPLVINAAKLFYRKVPKSSITLIDMISVSAQGLASGVDKYTGDKNGNYSEVFRSVLLGRAAGNLIKEYSSTFLHFYPSDRKIMYKANSIRGRQGITDVVELSSAINVAFEEDARQGLSIPKGKVNPAELQELLNAASLISVEATVNEDGFGAYDYTPDENLNAEENLMRTQTNEKIAKLISKLPLLHRKVLRLKGVQF